MFSDLGKEFTWIQRHERLLLAVAGGLILWFAIGKIDTLILHHDQAGLAEAKATAAAQAQKNTEIAILVTQQAVDMKALNDRVQSQNAALEQANIALVAALTKQQRVDSVMTDPELAMRWNQLVPQATVSTTPSGVTLTSVGAHATVNELEKVPVLAKELDASQQEMKNEVSLMTQSGIQVVTLNQNVSGLKLQIIDNDKACQEQIKVVKDEARKSKRKWAIIGSILGFIGRQAIKSGTGF